MAVVIHLQLCCMGKKDERKLLAIYVQLIWYYSCFILTVSDL